MTRSYITRTISSENLNIRISNLLRALDLELRISSWFMFGLAGLCCLTGCAQHDYKAEADEKVYNIIDQKWKEDFGSKANYRVSDVAPSANDIQVAKSIPDGGVLSLAQAVAIATAYNRDYQTQKEKLYTTALDLRLTRHTFESRFSGGLSGGYGRDRNDEASGAEANLGLKRLLATGTMISTKVSAAYVDVCMGNMRSGLASVLSAAVTQPLLRGSDPAIVLEDLTQAERDTLYQLRLFNRFRQAFVVSVISQYYQVLKLYEAATNAQRNYDTIVSLAGRVEKLTNAGRLPRLELDRLRQETLQARDTYVQARKEYEQAVDQFKITLSVPTTVEFGLEEGVLHELKVPDFADIDFDEAEAIRTALARRLDLANSADAVADAQRKVFVAADALRAGLNLTGTADVVPGRRGNRRTMQFTEDYLLDLDLDLPLDRVAEQNVYRKALLKLNQRKRQYELASDTITVEVRQAYRDLKEAAERYGLQSEGLKLAQERFRKTNVLMQYARASSRRVLDAQRALFDAQNAAAEALVNYAIATLSFYRDTGVLQVRPDGMWEEGTDGLAPTGDLALVGASFKSQSGKEQSNSAELSNVEMAARGAERSKE
jgi:outer membrane protein TolC